MFVVGLRSFVTQFFLSLPNPFIRRLYLLAALGETGPYTGTLMHQFQGLGVLHLLVLSGTQVEHVVRGLRLAIALARRSVSMGTGFRWAWNIGAAGALFLFGVATSWPPPLTRAVIVAVLSLALPRLSWGILFALGFAAHWLLFPHHVHSVGFLLSWFASGLLRITAEWRFQKLWRSAVVTILTSVVACWLLPKNPAMTGGFLLMACLANWALGWFFDVALMPVTGVVLTLGVLLSPFGASARYGGRILGAFVAPVLELLGSVLLVALDGFRYIQSP